MTKMNLALGLLLLLVLAVVGLGCVQSDDAEAGTNDDGNGEAQTAQAASDDDDSSVDGADDGTSGDNDEDDEDEEEAVPVEVITLTRGGIESVLRFSSNLEAEAEVQVFSQAKRLVQELLVEEGDHVPKDRVLVRLQDAEQRSQLAKAHSQLAKAEREFKRQKRLFEQELISQQVFTDAQFEYEQAQISVEDAERELSYTTVRAPIAGIVTQRLVKVGDQVQIGQHLFDIVDFDSIVARIFVPEKYLLGLKPGLKARITAAAIGGHEHIGTVERVAPIVDPQSGTVKVTIAMGKQHGMRPGLYVDVDLVTATHPDAVLVPKRALVYDSDQVFVFRLGEERRVEQVFIQPLLSDKGFIEPVDGLEADDRIVIAGQTGLKDKALVALPGDDDEEEDEVASDKIADNTRRAAS